MVQNLSEDYKKLLKDFILLEMLHDYKEIRGTKGKNARVINTYRYKYKHKSLPVPNKENFDAILNIGIPNSFKPPDSSYNYNETADRMFTTNEPETTMLSYMTGMSSKTTIQSFMNLKVLKDPSGVGKWNFTCPISDNHYNVTAVARTDEGVEFANNLFEKNPVILTDTMVWVWSTFKSGPKPTAKNKVQKIYCFSPLPVRADSASKAECINYKDIKTRKPYSWFENVNQNNNGIPLVNIISNKTYTSEFLPVNSEHGFFSKYKITTEINPYDDKLIIQKWSGLNYAGDQTPNSTNRTVKINNAHDENSQPKTFSVINNLINDKNNKGTFDLLENDKILNKLVNGSGAGAGAGAAINNKDAINIEIVSLALQRKRSGDWLPVHYIRDFKLSDEKLQDFSLKEDESDLLRTELNDEDKEEYFTKENMYILTNDRPLVAYCILCGVNVLFIAATTPDPLLIKFEKKSQPSPSSPGIFNIFFKKWTSLLVNKFFNN